MSTSYAPETRDGLTVCRHCAHPAALHAQDWRCYTVQELEAAMRFHDAQGRWPAGLYTPLATRRALACPPHLGREP